MDIDVEAMLDAPYQEKRVRNFNILLWEGSSHDKVNTS